MQTTASPIDIVIFFTAALLILSAIIFFLFKSLAKKDEIDYKDNSVIYAAQLKDLETDLEEGRIDAQDFSSAKNEILKRILRAKNQTKGEYKTNVSKMIPLFSAGFIGLCAIGIYFFIGNPLMKDMPIKSREKELLARNPETLGENEIMLLLQSRAQENPKDAIPHLLMGKILASDGRDNDALHAFQAALRRDGNNAETLAELGGTFLRLSDYQIDKEFLGAEAAALKLEPDNSTAHFYRGLALWKNDEKKEAMEQWSGAWEKYKNDDPRKIGLAYRIMDEISKLDVGPKMGSGGPMMGGGKMPPMMAAAMEGKNPQEFIQTMIAQRTAKLDADPKDLGLRLSLAKVIAKTDNQKSLSILTDGLKYQDTEFGRQLLGMAIANQGQQIQDIKSQAQTGQK